MKRVCLNPMLGFHRSVLSVVGSTCISKLCEVSIGYLEQVNIRRCSNELTGNVVYSTSAPNVRQTKSPYVAAQIDDTGVWQSDTAAAR